MCVCVWFPRFCPDLDVCTCVFAFSAKFRDFGLIRTCVRVCVSSNLERNFGLFGKCVSVCVFCRNFVRRASETPEILFSWRFRPNPDVCKCVFRFCAKFQVSVCKCVLFFDDFCLRSRNSSGYGGKKKERKKRQVFWSRGLVFFLKEEKR